MEQRQIANRIYYFAYILALFNAVMVRSFFASHFGKFISINYLIVWGLIGLREFVLLCKKQYHKYTWVMLLLAAALALLVIKNQTPAAAIEFATIIPLAYSARNLEFRTLAKITAIVETCLLVFVIACALFGVIENYRIGTYDIYGIESTSRVRCYLGFLGPLFPLTFYLNIEMMIVYLTRGKLRAWHAIMLLAGACAIFLATEGRLCFLLSVATVIFGWGYSLWCMRTTIPEGSKAEQIWLGIATIFFPVMLVFSVAVSYFYNGEIGLLAKINSLLESRLRLAHDGFTSFGVSLLGNRIEMFGQGLSTTGQVRTAGYNWVDNAWMNILFRYGILFTGAVCALYSRLMYALARKRDYFTIVLFLLIGMQMLIDDCNLMYYWNGLLLMLAMYSFGGNDVSKD